ncbi:extracellular solute-binding protein [Paenibacillus sanguinis]|uniref:extracellular solute-binding protein n=1 Tax=Paenibacillus sanguinis TaxID=225906 RepID=UPI0003807598|nr:extracellular solute-binding protein [Paenibacillus sanguinis]
MRTKIKWMLTVLLVASLMLLAACGGQEEGGQGESNKKVTLWAGGSDNVREMFEKQIGYFNANNPDGYEVELQFITSGTGTQNLIDRIIAAKKAGETSTDFDLIELDATSVLQYLAEGGEDLFVPIDTSKVPNMSDLQFEATYRSDLVVPYRGTTVVLAYNSETVPEPPKTAEDMYQWIKDHPGRFAYNTPGSGGAGSSFVVTSVYNDLAAEALTSSDEKWTAEWDPGFKFLEELHPYLYQSGGRVVYPNKNQGSIDLLANKEVDMIPAWADMIISQKREGVIPDSIEIAQIAPSFTGSTVALGIPAFGSNSEGAHAFINYMLTPEAQNIALDSMAAIPVIEFSKLDPELADIISGLEIEEFRINSIGGLGTKLNERWDEEIGTLE